MSSIKIIENFAGTTLETFPLDQEAKAFVRAQFFEDMGIDISIVNPSTPETLIGALGADDSDKARLKEQIHAEIESHNCCE